MSGPEKVRRGRKAASAGSSSSGMLDEVDELSKDEKQIARYLRLSCAKKQGNFHSMKVDFFIGQKLVDALMESKWGPQSGKNASPLLINRNACVALMQRLMNKQLFYRAIKIYKESSGDESKVVCHFENRYFTSSCFRLLLLLLLKFSEDYFDSL